MQNIIIFIHFSFLFLIVFVTIFNVFYAIRVNNTKHHLGIAPPQFIQKLLLINIVLSVASSILLTFFIFRL